ncbi:hypothetical protein ALC60_12923, partial [Trachymyrmex zeteki]
SRTQCSHMSVSRNRARGKEKKKRRDVLSTRLTRFDIFTVTDVRNISRAVVLPGLGTEPTEDMGDVGLTPLVEPALKPLDV